MTVGASTSRHLPVAVYLMAFSLFAMGSAEFLLAGVLPIVANDLDVSLTAAGGLVTSFAIGVVIGGPPFAVISLRWPRRTALVATQLVFAGSIAAGLLANTYPALTITRFIAGLAYAGFFAVAAATAVSLVAADRAARASGVVVSGLSLAMVIGGPVGTLMGYQIGWQAGFWLVIGLTIAGVVGVMLTTPSNTRVERPSVRRELAALRRPRLWLVLLVTVLSTAAYMITFTYLSEILRTVTGIGDTWIAAVLVVFGVGAYIGLAIGGRIADRLAHAVILIGATGICITSVLIVAFAQVPAILIPLVLFLGVFGFVLNPAIYGRVFTLAADAPTLAGATAVSSFQLGISIVPVLAGIAFAVGMPIMTAVWIGAGLAVLTIPVALAEAAGDARLTTTETRRTRSVGRDGMEQ
jgi:DHA1 family chloramphenicol resistance protein-like MFS transporter